jgi:hypothetical protein
MWLARQTSCSFSRYSRSSRSLGSLAMMRMSAVARSSTSRSAVSSSWTPLTRSLVARDARDTVEVTTMAAMKNDAIRTPSGRSTTLTTVV